MFVNANSNALGVCAGVGCDDDSLDDVLHYCLGVLIQVDKCVAQRYYARSASVSGVRVSS